MSGNVDIDGPPNESKSGTETFGSIKVNQKQLQQQKQQHDHIPPVVDEKITEISDNSKPRHKHNYFEFIDNISPLLELENLSISKSSDNIPPATVEDKSGDSGDGIFNCLSQSIDLNENQTEDVGSADLKRPAQMWPLETAENVIKFDEYLAAAQNGGQETETQQAQMWPLEKAVDVIDFNEYLTNQNNPEVPAINEQPKMWPMERSTDIQSFSEYLTGQGAGNETPTVPNATMWPLETASNIQDFDSYIQSVADGHADLKNSNIENNYSSSANLFDLDSEEEGADCPSDKNKVQQIISDFESRILQRKSSSNDLHDTREKSNSVSSGGNDPFEMLGTLDLSSLEEDQLIDNGIPLKTALVTDNSLLNETTHDISVLPSEIEIDSVHQNGIDSINHFQIPIQMQTMLQGNPSDADNDNVVESPATSENDFDYVSVKGDSDRFMIPEDDPQPQIEFPLKSSDAVLSITHPNDLISNYYSSYLSSPTESSSSLSDDSSSSEDDCKKLKMESFLKNVPIGTKKKSSLSILLSKQISSSSSSSSSSSESSSSSSSSDSSSSSSSSDSSSSSSSDSSSSSSSSSSDSFFKSTKFVSRSPPLPRRGPIVPKKNSKFNKMNKKINAIDFSVGKSESYNSLQLKSEKLNDSNLFYISAGAILSFILLVTIFKTSLLKIFRNDQI